MDFTQFLDMYDRADRTMGSVADMLLDQSGILSLRGDHINVLDMACGTGVVASRILSKLQTGDQALIDLTCADISEALIAPLSTMIKQKNWSNVRAVVADAMDTGFPAGNFNYITFNFGPFILSDSMAGVRECFRILQPGGTLGCTTFHTVPWLIDFRSAVEANADLPRFPTDDQFATMFADSPEHRARWDDVDEVKANLEKAGFVDVKTKVGELSMTMAGFDEVKAIFPYTLDMVMSKFWTAEQIARYRSLAVEMIESHLEKIFGGGSIIWSGSFIVATGTKPA